MCSILNRFFRVSFGIWLASFVAIANAGTINCLASNAAKVSNTQDCELSTSATQDFLHNPLTVNQEEFFGFNDWSFISKDDDPANAQNGNWSLDDSLWDFYSSIMLIFKSGAGTTLVGYLVNDGAPTGTWSSPFSAPQFNGPGMVDKKGKPKAPKDVSHISVYGRGVASVPETSGLALLMLGLVGLWAARRRM